MALFDWSDDYELDIAQIDDQHRELVKMINELYASLKAGDSKRVDLKSQVGRTHKGLRPFLPAFSESIASTQVRITFIALEAIYQVKLIGKSG